MQHERDDNATDSAKPEMLSYARPRQPGEGLLTREKRFTFTWMELIFVGLIIVVLVSIVSPEFLDRRQRHRAYTVACQSNMRQVSIALQNYVRDHRGVYPMHIADVAQYVGGGAGACFVCPLKHGQHSPGPTTAQLEVDLRNPAKACCSYVFVVPGRKVQGMKPDAIILYEPLPAIHKNGLVNFAYADCSIRGLTPAEAKWALAELAAGFNPPRAINSVPATTPSR
jgi:hypothetical protein